MSAARILGYGGFVIVVMLTSALALPIAPSAGFIMVFSFRCSVPNSFILYCRCANPLTPK